MGPKATAGWQILADDLIFFQKCWKLFPLYLVWKDPTKSPIKMRSNTVDNISSKCFITEKRQILFCPCSTFRYFLFFKTAVKFQDMAKNCWTWCVPTNCPQWTFWDKLPEGLSTVWFCYRVVNGYVDFWRCASSQSGLVHKRYILVRL
jgi:hypothetical protein